MGRLEPPRFHNPHELTRNRSPALEPRPNRWGFCVPTDRPTDRRTDRRPHPVPIADRCHRPRAALSA